MTRIAIVDDNRLALLQMNAILRGCGFDDIALYHDPRDALAACRREPPDVLLVDYSMPHLNGLELIEALRDDAAPSPAAAGPAIALVTAQHLHGGLRHAARAAGAQALLDKPLRSMDFATRIKALAQRRQGAAALAHGAARPDEPVLRLLERVASIRDEATGNHTARMAHYAAAIGHAYGLSLAEQDELLGAAPLHDIGKIGVPDAILHKPGLLTPQERQAMQRHTLIGHALLSGEALPLLQLGAQIALSHHEHWDGTGYPHGLRGEAIPLAARIVAVADVFDALTTVRPYKDAWAVERAAAVIQADAGGHFDPGVVDAFRTAMDSLLAIRQHFETGVAAAPAQPR